MRKIHQSNNPNGFILILVLITSFVFTISLMGITNLSFSTYRASRHALLNLNSLAVAEGGADASILALNNAAITNASYTGTTAPASNTCALASLSTKTSNAVTLYNNLTQGKATYETCIQDNNLINDPSDASKNRYEKILFSVGKIYQPSSAAAPVSVSRVKLVLEGSPTGDFSVQTGPGGLVMSNSATVTNGNVYVGGGLTMTNSSAIGSPGSPANIYVANYLCPKTTPYTGYPSLCGSGEPISISNSAKIYGSVYANGQVTTTGMSSPGLVQSSGVGITSLPNYDRALQKSKVTTMLTGDQSCGGSSTITLQANTKIAGNLSLSNNCTVLVKGDVWITGNYTSTQKGNIQVDPSVTTTPHVMIDGSGGLNLGQQSSVSSNSTGVGFEIITMYSTAPCNPDCTTVTGSDLVNSIAVTTINLGNQAVGAGSTFYARWTSLNLGNGGSIGAILAEKIFLSNAGTIVFGQSAIAPTSFAWSVRYYEQMPVKDAQTTN